MRRTILVVVALALATVVLAALALRQPAVQDRLVDRAIEAAMGRSQGLFSEDTLRVLLCGSAGPFPHATRAGPCVAVFAGGRFWVVDAGPRSWNRLALLGVDGARIGGVLLTHFHSDHIGELGEIDLQTWVAGRSAPLRVFGPPGVERVVAGFEAAYELDAGYRIAHHGSDLLPADVGRMQAVPLPGPDAGGGPRLVLEEGDLRITAFAVDHAPVHPAYGYRFDYRGRSVVVSGDTAADPGLVEAARGADVLMHEAQANHMVERIQRAAGAAGRPRVEKIMGDIPDYHTSPVEAARQANEAGVKLVVFYHLTPPPPLALADRIYVRGVTDVRPDGWILGDDGLLVELPVDSDEVRTRQLD